MICKLYEVVRLYAVKDTHLRQRGIVYEAMIYGTLAALGAFPA